MNIATLEPWNLVSALHRDVGQLAARNSHTANAGKDSRAFANWIPAVDIVEEKSRFVLRADVPGLKAENINISMEKGVLSVSGQRQPSATDEGETLQLRERSSGDFERHFTLPESANADGISAVCADGILEIAIPKQAEIEARRIAVNAA